MKYRSVLQENGKLCEINIDGARDITIVDGGEEAKSTKSHETKPGATLLQYLQHTIKLMQ